MPELPEVEVLARHLRPLIRGKTIRAVNVRRAKVLLPTLLRKFRRTLLGAKFNGVSRRGKYLLFQLRTRASGKPISLLGHLGMTGRIFLAQKGRPLPRHTAVALDFGTSKLVYEDTRYFGRLTLDTSAVTRLGPEPLDDEFKAETFAQSLKRSRQAIKVKLLDQRLVAGIGNIYASEALFRALISPLAGGEQTDQGASPAASARHSRGAGRSDQTRQHRPAEFGREQVGWPFLFWPCAGRAGFLRGTPAGL